MHNYYFIIIFLLDYFADVLCFFDYICVTAFIILSFGQFYTY